jgi:hypothetical protein
MQWGKSVNDMREEDHPLGRIVQRWLRVGVEWELVSYFLVRLAQMCCENASGFIYDDIWHEPFFAARVSWL